MKKYFVLLTIIFGGLLIGCKNKEIQYHLITNQDLIDAVSIKMGSYFIYRDSVTGIVDSFFVDGDYYKGSRTEEDDYNYYEFIRYDPKTIDYNGFAYLLGGNSWALNKIFGSFNYFYVSYSSINYLTLPFPEGTNEAHYEKVWNYIKHYDSLAVNGIFYKNVYETETETDKWKFRSFYSLDNGLVRFITISDTAYHNWKLIRSNVIR